jgi:hypothetical protein
MDRNAKLKDISLQTSWNCRRQLVEEEWEFMKPVLEDLECAGVDMLLPSGTLLFDLPDNPEGVDESLEDSTGVLDSDMNIGSSRATDDADLRVEVEDSLTEVLDNRASQQNNWSVDKIVIIKGTKLSKAQALALDNTVPPILISQSLHTKP